MILAMALASVAVLSLVALSLSALRGERKASDSLVGELVASEAMERLVYDMQASTSHPLWAQNSATVAYGTENTVSSGTEFTLVTYASDMDSATFTPRRLKRLHVVARWWRAENDGGGRSGMGKLEAHAIRLVREP